MGGIRFIHSVKLIFMISILMPSSGTAPQCLHLLDTQIEAVFSVAVIFLFEYNFAVFSKMVTIEPVALNS
jgi:hypothetical protein